MEPDISSTARPAASGGSVCSACGSALKMGDLFCRQCGPPEPPPERVPEALPMGKAVLRIAGIIVVFGLVVFFKTQPDLGVEVKKLITGLKPQFQTTDPENKPQDADFKLVHTVNVPFANIRAKASVQSAVVTVLERGEKVSVLFKGDRWTQIELQGKTGWIATRLLDSRIE